MLFPHPTLSRRARLIYTLPIPKEPSPQEFKRSWPRPALVFVLLMSLLLACLRGAMLSKKLSTTPPSEAWVFATSLEGLGNIAPGSVFRGSGSKSVLKELNTSTTSHNSTYLQQPIHLPAYVAHRKQVPTPFNGVPPRNLPYSHPLRTHLDRIRRRVCLSPRWPAHRSLRPTKLRSFGPAYSSIIFSERLKVIYVPVFKVGTTSMMWHIAYLENNPYVLSQNFSAPGSREFYLHEMSGPAWQDHTLYRKNAREIRKLFDNPEYLKFGFVRNPFDRVISAYLDKIAGHPIESGEYQTQMYSLYGDDVEMRGIRNHTKPTFRDFLFAIEQVLKQPRTNSSGEYSFEDNTSRRDLHWRPQVELLHPDLIHFDFVGRFERLVQDRAVVLDWMYKHTERRMPQDYEEKLHSTDPQDKVQLRNELQLDIELKKLILRVYEVDFDSFQFSRELPWVSRAQH